MTTFSFRHHLPQQFQQAILGALAFFFAIAASAQHRPQRAWTPEMAAAEQERISTAEKRRSSNEPTAATTEIVAANESAKAPSPSKAYRTFLPLMIKGMPILLPVHDPLPEAGATFVNTAYRLFHGRAATATEQNAFAQYSALDAATRIYMLRSDATALQTAAQVPELLQIHDGLMLDPAVQDQFYELPDRPGAMAFTHVVLIGDAPPTPRDSKDYVGYIYRTKDGLWRYVTNWDGPGGTSGDKRDWLRRVADNHYTCAVFGCDPSEFQELGDSVLVLRHKILGDIVVGSRHKVVARFTAEKRLHDKPVTSLSVESEIDFMDPKNPSYGTRYNTQRLVVDGRTVRFNTMRSCFAAGTLVWTEKGPLPIEQINVGDLVWSTDERTGKSGYKPVREIFTSTANEYVDVRIGGELIRSTLEHPFRIGDVQNGVWVPASTLLKGTKVLRSAGATVQTLATHEQIAVEEAASHLGEIRTYNFEVADWNTYHVGKTGVLVHNASRIFANQPITAYPADTVKLSMTTAPSISLNSAATPIDAKASKALPAVGQIVVNMSSAATRMGTGAVNAIRGFFTGAAANQSTMVVGKIEPIVGGVPAYVRHANSIGAFSVASVPAASYSLAGNIGTVVGFAARHGAGSIVAQPGVPYTGVFAAEMSAAFTLRVMGAGVALSAPFAIANYPSYTGDDTFYWDSVMGETSMTQPSAHGNIQMFMCGPGDVYYPDPLFAF